MKTRFILLTALLVAVLPRLSGASDIPATSAAEESLKASVSEIMTVVKGCSTRDALISGIKPVIEKILNFNVMTRRSIGPGWKQFTPQQQEEATKLFTTLILRTYTAKFTPGECPAVEYKSAGSSAIGRVEVFTTSIYLGNRYDVIYRMENQSGSWAITDIVIEGVSMIANYRSQFESEYTRGGTDAIIKALQRSVTETK
jgi:phospholipid transport system substrate-binding protein